MRTKASHLYPIVFSVFPVLNLYVQNADEIEFLATINTFVGTILATLLIYLALSLLYKNTEKGAFLTFIIAVFFFSSGHLSSYLPKHVLGVAVAEGMTIQILFASVISITAMFLRYTDNFPKKITYSCVFLSTMLLILTTIPLINKMDELNTDWYKSVENENKAVLGITTTRPACVKCPDIYYIVMDGRARSETLLRLFDYNDTKIVKKMDDLGFFIAKNSKANYIQTLLSVSSTLNMGYHDKLSVAMGDQSDYRVPLKYMLNNSFARRYFTDRGYKYSSISGGFAHLAETGTSAEEEKPMEVATKDFGDMFLRTTIISTSTSESSYRYLARDILESFSQLKSMTTDEEPTFTYLHVLSPHPPFIFDEKGNYTTPTTTLTSNGDGDHFAGSKDDYRKGYAEQVRFMDKLLLQTVEHILTNSNIPPIIIIQSDHGSGYGLDWESLTNTDLEERFQITNWYYFPNINKADLPEDITPVNTFRYVLSKYFNENLPLLPNKSYFSTWSQPYKFIDVTKNI